MNLRMLAAPALSAIGKPIIPDPIPGLNPEAIPRKFGAEFAVPDLDLLGAVAPMVRQLNSKLLAEDARMRRLLPPAPEGYEWRGEIASDIDYLGFSAAATFRIRYRLVEGADDA